jgi:hypothetical protein
VTRAKRQEGETPPVEHDSIHDKRAASLHALVLSLEAGVSADARWPMDARSVSDGKQIADFERLGQHLADHRRHLHLRYCRRCEEC